LTFSVYMSHEKVSFARHCRANDTFFVNCSNPVNPVEQLISCQKCRANDCRAIAFRAVHPHSTHILMIYFKRTAILKVQLLLEQQQNN
jgi:hypothetical protein